jgi:nitronate monooxygenase
MAHPWTHSGLPLIAAPMAGGATTPALVSAVSAAGGFGFLAAGYRTAAAVAADAAVLRAAGQAFGVNVFVPTPGTIHEDAFRPYARELAADGARYGLDLANAPLLADDDDHWQEKIDWLLSEPVPIVSFTFGLPPAPVITALRRAGSAVYLTVTDADEAGAAVAAGADGLALQGFDAGGHSGILDPRRPLRSVPLPELVARVSAVVDVPVVAAGGVHDPRQVAELLGCGATAVVVGTALLRCAESGASAVHQAALVDPQRRETVITHAFTGRPARGLRNGFIDRHEATAPFGYPAIHHLTRGMRAAAAAAGEPDQVHLWAGTGYRRARAAPAAEIVADLTRDL